VIPSNREPQVLEGYTLTRHGGAVHIQADGVEELNGLLTLGAERRWKILGVGTRRSGLEELFMQTRDQGEAKS
ncbi:hypothetical protein GW813_04295, partial [bacterium]|nr:hypothetical protein [bacterium]